MGLDIVDRGSGRGCRTNGRRDSKNTYWVGGTSVGGTAVGGRGGGKGGMVVVGKGMAG